MPLLAFALVSVILTALLTGGLAIATPQSALAQTQAPERSGINLPIPDPVFKGKNEPLTFGHKGREPSNNPFRIALSEWGFLWRDFRCVPSLRGKLKVLFGSP